MMDPSWKTKGSPPGSKPQKFNSRFHFPIHFTLCFSGFQCCLFSLPCCLTRPFTCIVSITLQSAHVHMCTYICTFCRLVCIQKWELPKKDYQWKSKQNTSTTWLQIKWQTHSTFLPGVWSRQRSGRSVCTQTGQSRGLPASINMIT